MIHRLEPSHYHRVYPILEGAEHALAVNAVAEGTAPGFIYVDDVTAPRALFSSTPEGHHLIGNADNEAFNAALAALITEQIIPRGRAAGWAVLYLHYFPDPWEAKLDPLFQDSFPVKNYQHFFMFRERRIAWQDHVPAGFVLKQVDAELLGQDGLRNVERIRDHAEGSFHSVEQFLQHGFGFCLLHQDDIACWCTADCVSGTRCEVGIHTDARYRRRGLATLTLAATVDYCLAHGLTEIGWHCWRQNWASAATAEKVGFEHVRRHHAFIVWLCRTDGLLVNGNLALMDRRFEEAAQLYERGFALREEEERAGRRSYLLRAPAQEMVCRYNAACASALAGDREAALEHLEEAFSQSGYRQGAY